MSFLGNIKSQLLSMPLVEMFSENRQNLLPINLEIELFKNEMSFPGRVSSDKFHTEYGRILVRKQRPESARESTLKNTESSLKS